MNIIAQVPILHYGRQYQQGDEIKDCDTATLELWLKYKTVIIVNDNGTSSKEPETAETEGTTRGMNFQEQLEKDANNVFFNAENKEFATTHRIAGVRGASVSTVFECDVVVDYELYKERTSKGTGDKIENLSVDGSLFFIKKEDWISKFTKVPKVGSELMFDDIRYKIASVTDDTGTLEIMLTSPRG